MASVTLSEVRKAYSGFEVIHGVSLDVRSGEFLVLVGPSGCGKSTLLRMIAGLEDITDGTIAIGDRIVNDLPASQRNLSMVFQSYALYPHMSVRKNLAFGLGNLRMPKPEIARRVADAARILQIEELLERKPRQLSGGQKQRVAIGRAIVREPQLFLFDEPLSNLDAELRVQMRVELAGLYQRLGTTMIYVTHDQIEAMTMATRIVVLNKGNVEQVGTPFELYNFPRNLFVAGFIGSPKMNLLSASVTDGRADITALGSLTLPSGIAASGAITIGLRPEQLTLEGDGDLSLSGTISLVEYLGSEVFIYLRLDAGQGPGQIQPPQWRTPHRVAPRRRCALFRRRRPATRQVRRADPMTALLHRLRDLDVAARVGDRGQPATLGEWLASGVAFASSSARIEERYYQAIRELLDCIKPTAVTGPILHEGGIYHGCWLESTGTINTELLARFLPAIATETYTAFATQQRDDGLIPYKIAETGPAFSQIQLVTPLARCVWNHFLLNGRDRAWLAQMYAAMARYDDWLSKYRDTRRTGGVEAFSTYDTGHDLSARFWHVPDSPFHNDPTRANPDNPILPFIAPDLTANVACQRSYLARIAAELGEPAQPWRDKAEASLKALFEQCYDETDGFFYDRDRHGQLVRVQSDVLLRVLACEIGTDDFFAESLQRYLLNTRKFFAKYPLTSIALDDPRFDPNFGQNSWSGPSNFLSIIRAPHAFEHHHRHVELSWLHHPILAALCHADSFPQTLNPFTGAAGFTTSYSPAILCLLDFIERLCGILPRPDGEVWFTGLVPLEVSHKDEAHQTAYRRQVDGQNFELLNDGVTATIFRNGEQQFAFPHGVRLITDRTGNLLSLTGMVARTVAGTIDTPDGLLLFTIGPNEALILQNGMLVQSRAPSLVPPSYS